MQFLATQWTVNKSFLKWQLLVYFTKFFLREIWHFSLFKLPFKAVIIHLCLVTGILNSSLLLYNVSVIFFFFSSEALLKFQRSWCCLGAKIRPEINRGSYMNLSRPMKWIYCTPPENPERMLRYDFLQYNKMIPEYHGLTVYSQTWHFQAVNYLS